MKYAKMAAKLMCGQDARATYLDGHHNESQAGCLRHLK